MTRSNTRLWILGILAIDGLVAELYFLARFFQTRGDGPLLTEIWTAANANPMASLLFWFTMLAFVAYLLVLVPEAAAQGLKPAWLFYLLAFIAPFAFVFPLLLWQWERVRPLPSTAAPEAIGSVAAD